MADVEDIIGMIMADGDSDARMHARAAASALRGQRDAGELLGSVGGSTPYAQSARALGTASLSNEQQGENRMIQGAGVREQALLRRALGLDRANAVTHAADVRAGATRYAADARAAASRDVAHTMAGARPTYGQPVIGLDGALYMPNLRNGSLDQQTEALSPDQVVKGGRAGARPMDAKTAQAQSNFDMALDRLDRLDGMFREGIGTYRGASTLHDIAAVAGVEDPRFDVLRSLSKSHLFKGLKSDIGGRITNFEIQYGKDMFPNESDRPEQALAKINMLRQVLMRDKEIAALNGGGGAAGGAGGPKHDPMGLLGR